MPWPGKTRSTGSTFFTGPCWPARERDPESALEVFESLAAGGDNDSYRHRARLLLSGMRIRSGRLTEAEELLRKGLESGSQP